MRVVIENAVFASSDRLPVISLCQYASAGRHRVIPEDESHPLYLAWLTSVGDIREECLFSIATSYREEAASPATHEIRVANVGAIDVSGPMPRVPLSQAYEFLSRPYEIVLEDRESDRAFWLTMCTPAQRKAVLRREDAGYLVFAHGGGVTNMIKWADSLSEPLARFRHSFLFDSDALAPGAPQVNVRRLQEVCTNRRIRHHALRRRFMESYLPRDTLRGWTFGVSRRQERERRSEILSAFLRLNEPQRHHYNMKEGFDGDRRRLKDGRETDSGLYDNVDDATRRALESGFHPKIGQVYDPPGEQVSEVDLRREGAWEELNGAISLVLAEAR